MTGHHVFDVVGLETDLGKLRRNSVVLGHLEAEALGERSPPSLGIGDRLVVVSGVDDDVALGMFEHVEADRRPVDIALRRPSAGAAFGKPPNEPDVKT